jgi:hypothetical protein
MRDSGLSSAKDNSFTPDGRHIRTSNRASRGDNYHKNRIRTRIGTKNLAVLAQFTKLRDFITGYHFMKVIRCPDFRFILELPVQTWEDGEPAERIE